MNLVFASGFLVPQHFTGIDYFLDLKDHLGGQHHALFPDVPALGSSEQRAERLAEKIAAEFPQGPIHIIAHSMGGLDSRVLIGRNLRGLSVEGRIASLTTLSTPHHGSPVADLLLSGAGGFTFDLVKTAVEKLGIPAGALEDLTKEGAQKIPDAAKSHPHIRYRSYFAAGRPGLLPTSILLAPTHSFIMHVTNQVNDGLVALDSAQYGEFQQPFWLCDHVDITGHNLNNLAGKSPFDHLAHIDAIIKQL